MTGVLRSELDDLGIVIDVDQMTAALGGLLSAAACSRTGTRENLCLNGMRMLLDAQDLFVDANKMLENK